MTPSNIVVFNQMVGLIFDRLYQSFPEYIQIEPEQIARAMDIDWTDTKETKETWVPSTFLYPESHFGDRNRRTYEETVRTYQKMKDNGDFRVRLAHTVTWLHSEDFIRRYRKSSNWTLTSRAFLALNATPLAVSDGPAETLGSQLNELASAAASDTRRAAIGALVGQVIGAAVRYSGWGGPSSG